MSKTMEAFYDIEQCRDAASLAAKSSVKVENASRISLLSLPTELLAQITGLARQPDRVALWQTCRWLRNSELIKRVVFAEPISRHNFSILYEEARHYTGAALEYYDEQKHYNYPRMLDELSGSYVRKLVIPNFLSIEHIRLYAQMCPNIQYLDLESFMPEIDGPMADDAALQIIRSGLLWRDLINDCAGLFTNVRSMKLAFYGTHSIINLDN